MDYFPAAKGGGVRDCSFCDGEMYFPRTGGAGVNKIPAVFE
jgi:hypothetical protein